MYLTFWCLNFEKALQDVGWGGRGGGVKRARYPCMYSHIQTAPPPRTTMGGFFSPVRKHPPLGAYRMPRILWVSQGGGQFLIGEVPLYCQMVTFSFLSLQINSSPLAVQRKAYVGA